jgi:hypothetical protein
MAQKEKDTKKKTMGKPTVKVDVSTTKTAQNKDKKK